MVNVDLAQLGLEPINRRKRSSDRYGPLGLTYTQSKILRHMLEEYESGMLASDCIAPGASYVSLVRQGCVREVPTSSDMRQCSQLSIYRLTLRGLVVARILRRMANEDLT